MIKPSSLNEKFPGLRTPSPSPRHLRQAIDLIGLIKRVYYLVALAWAYGWVKAIGQFIESLDSVVKKRRSEEEKGGCPPKKNARDLCGKSHTKNCSLQDILSPNICMKRLLHQAWPLLHPLSPPPGKEKTTSARRKIVLSNKKGGACAPLESIVVVKTRSCKRRSAGPSRRPASCRNPCGSCASRCRRPSCSRCNPVPGWLPGFRRSGSC